MFNRDFLPAFTDHERNSLCEHYLHILYHNIQGHRASNEKLNDIGETYGEILYPSMDKILSTLPLTEHDVFFDLGSGLGKIVVQVFLRSLVKETYGIEYLPELHQQAVLVSQKLQQDLPHFYEQGRKLNLILGDFLEIPLTEATVVLVSSPCFSPKTLYTLGNIINHTPSIHTVLTLRPIANLIRLRFKKAIRIECSWDTALCYIYGKS